MISRVFAAVFALALSGFTQTDSAVQAINITHAACASGCPAYSLRIERSGLVRYDGVGFVKVAGQKLWSLPERTAESLLDRVQSAGLIAGERAGRFLADQGGCANKTVEQPSSIVVQVNDISEMPIETCYSSELEKIVADADGLTAVSIYTTGHDTQSESAIKSVLDEQVAAWNRGDIDGFMRGYWMSKDLTFFSGGSETHGWTETLQRYRKSYQGTGKQMGQLTFGDLRIEMLSPESAFVRGSWRLLMPDGKTPHGLFTLIFRKMPDGWRIIHDSTGAAS